MSFLNIILLLIALFMLAILIITVVNGKKNASFNEKDKDDNYDWNDTPAYNVSKLKVFVLDLSGNIFDYSDIPPSDNIFVIGSSPEKTDLRIVERGVSREHLHVFAGGSPEYIWDNNSKYGTFHNGEKAEKVLIKDRVLVWLAQTPVVIARKGENSTNENVKAFFLEEKKKYGVPIIEEK